MIWWITVALDLLVHKSLLNSVLLSPTVSGGVRPKQNPPDKNPTLFAAIRGSVWVRTPPRGSDKVRSTVSVSFQQKIPTRFCPTMSYGIRKWGLWPRGLCLGGGRLTRLRHNVEPVTNTSSCEQTTTWNICADTFTSVNRQLQMSKLAHMFYAYNYN